MSIIVRDTAAARWLRGGPVLFALACTSAGAATPPSAPHATGASPQRPTVVQPTEPDPVSRNVVARARMLECGHQWSNMKRAGTASGTWKDFSRGCLAQR